MTTTPARRLPPWIRARLSAGGAFATVNSTLEHGDLHTVCQSALCPNRHECFSRGTATFMILGAVCTRKCAFCAVTTGAPGPLDPDEPARVAGAAKELGLGHVVVTSVTRDDLADGGASVFAGVIQALRREMPAATVEVLVPDFRGNAGDIATVLAAGPDVLNHNLETVRRLQQQIRSGANYETSLSVLRQAAAWLPAVAVKSGLMVGLGETDEEIHEAMQDLFASGCRLLTIGQYLAPSPQHRPVDRYVEPERFDGYRADALAMGFVAVAAAPLVRSSYEAGHLLAAARMARTA
ncbi:MAG: lipoyl synthase [bacterium]